MSYCKNIQSAKRQAKLQAERTYLPIFVIDTRRLAEPLDFGRYLVMDWEEYTYSDYLASDIVAEC